MTPEERVNEAIATTVRRAKREILADMAIYVVPYTVTSFGQLHDYVDANEYGGLCDPSFEFADVINPDTPEGIANANQVQEILDEWLFNGRRS